MTHQELRQAVGSLSEETLSVILDVVHPDGWEELSPGQKETAACLIKQNLQGKESAS